MVEALSSEVMARLFTEARTFNTWRNHPVSEEDLVRLHDLLRMGPTSANCSPARFVFVVSPRAKARLKPCLMAGNVDKTMAAPVTVIIGHDMAFHEHLPKLFPHTDARSWFAGNDELIAETAFRNGTLQGAYLILAARALGLDCGPMSGFDKAAVDAEFFPDGRVKSNFLCNLGYGDPEGLQARAPRFTFSETSRIE
ncbi:malonic semialdehyde reductase [Roseospirillum parvum]|uniref:Putative NADH dehydrogenase/NAD(P)H nitroreductase SAMN05421742_10867 n=1 Tax=Roseospirillum parvum TaxID=83401 RepID=A0A1G8DNC1_9PROT|nr:malonic semialdehyde reductase [Roseospirillum parvum]SDH59168.1 3-hydroxypropanoate dehydrogenase [Roseospirillum parvum]